MPVTIRRFQRDAIDGVVITRLGDDVGCSQTTDREASDRARALGDYVGRPKDYDAPAQRDLVASDALGHVLSELAADGEERSA